MALAESWDNYKAMCAALHVSALGLAQEVHDRASLGDLFAAGCLPLADSEWRRHGCKPQRRCCCAGEPTYEHSPPAAANATPPDDQPLPAPEVTMNGALQASDAPTPHPPTSGAAADPLPAPTAARVVEAQSERPLKTTQQQPVRVFPVARKSVCRSTAAHWAHPVTA